MDRKVGLTKTVDVFSILRYLDCRVVHLSEETRVQPIGDILSATGILVVGVGRHLVLEADGLLSRDDNVADDFVGLLLNRLETFHRGVFVCRFDGVRVERSLERLIGPLLKYNTIDTQSELRRVYEACKGG